MSRKMQGHLPGYQDKTEKTCRWRQRCRRKLPRSWRGSPACAAAPACSQTFAVMPRPVLAGKGWFPPCENASFVVDDTNDKKRTNDDLRTPAHFWPYNKPVSERKKRIIIRHTRV